MITALLLMAVTAMTAQTDSMKVDAGGWNLGMLAGLSAPIGSRGESNDLIPNGSAPGSYLASHISIPIAGSFDIDIGMGLGSPFLHIPSPDPLAEHLYPDYYLLSNNIGSFGTTEWMIGPTYRFHAGRWSLEPTVLATYSTLIPRDQRLFLKRKGSNEYRNIMEMTPRASGFTILPAVTLSYRLYDTVDAGVQLRFGYLGTSFAISPTITDQTLTGGNTSIITNSVYTHQSFFVMLGLYTTLKNWAFKL